MEGWKDGSRLFNVQNEHDHLLFFLGDSEFWGRVDNKMGNTRAIRDGDIYTRREWRRKGKGERDKRFDQSNSSGFFGVLSSLYVLVSRKCIRSGEQDCTDTRTHRTKYLPFLKKGLRKPLRVSDQTVLFTFPLPLLPCYFPSPTPISLLSVSEGGFEGTKLLYLTKKKEYAPAGVRPPVRPRESINVF